MMATVEGFVKRSKVSLHCISGAYSQPHCVVIHRKRTETVQEKMPIDPCKNLMSVQLTLSMPLDEEYSDRPIAQCNSLRRHTVETGSNHRRSRDDVYRNARVSITKRCINHSPNQYDMGFVADFFGAGSKLRCEMSYARETPLTKIAERLLWPYTKIW